MADAQELLVKVPEDLVPGQAVSFKLPDGSTMQATIPEGFKPGDKFPVTLPTMVTVTVPEGWQTGHVVFFDGPGGVKMQASVPEDKKPGDTFSVPMAPGPQMVTLTVPDGVEPGQFVYFDGPGGVQMKAAVPEGKKAGDTFQAPIMQAPPEQVYATITVPEGVEPGKAVNFQGPGGVEMRAVVPEGKKVGDTFEVAVNVPPAGAAAPSQQQGAGAPLELKVPEGGKPGDTIKFQAPDGSVMSTVVPEGKKEGDTFTVSLTSKEHHQLGQLCTAASGDDMEAIKAWVAQGVPVNGVYDLGFTPLIYAAMNGRLATVKYLLEQKADVAAGTNDNRLPLHFACRNGHTEVAKVLVEAKSPTDLKDVLGRTPLGTAIEKKQTATADAMKALGLPP